MKIKKSLVLLFFLSSFLKGYIKDVLILKKGKNTIVFLQDYHWDDKKISDAQEQTMNRFFKKLSNNFGKDSIVHLETTPGPHSQQEIKRYIKNNKDESCQTIFALQKAMFSGTQHNYNFELKSFEVRSSNDIKKSIHIPYKIAFGKEKNNKTLLTQVNEWIVLNRRETKQLLTSSKFTQLLSKQKIKKITQLFLKKLTPLSLPDQIQEVYKLASVKVDITLLIQLVSSDKTVQVVIGGRDHIEHVSSLLIAFDDWEKTYFQKGHDSSLWEKGIIDNIKN